MNITKKLIPSNLNQYSSNNPKYIVIHGTATPSATALNEYAYFSGGDRGSSAHIFIDDVQAIQIIEFNRGAWHCGDGYGKYGITNLNSIGIEMCVNSKGQFTEKTINNTIDVVKQLMKKYNISIDKVVRHYDASRKNCPAQKVNDDWKLWNGWTNFKNKLKESDKVATNELYRVRKTWIDAETQIGAYANKDSAISLAKEKGSAYKVYDKNGKQVYPEVKKIKGYLLVYMYDTDGLLCRAINPLLNRTIEVYNKSKDYSEYDVIAIGGSGYPKEFKLLSGATYKDTIKKVLEYIK